jgi:hypothetical protein
MYLLGFSYEFAVFNFLLGIITICADNGIHALIFMTRTNNKKVRHVPVCPGLSSIWRLSILY